MVSFLNGLLASAEVDVEGLDDAVNSLSPDQQNMLAAGLFGSLVVVGVFALVWYILQMAAQWRLFTKAGEPGWKCLIPFYNYFTQYKLTWNGTMFWVTLALTFMSALLSSISENGGSGLVSILSFVCGLVLFVIVVMANYKLSVSYGHGIGFTIGLLLLHPIFILILGFGGSEYIGPNGE